MLSYRICALEPGWVYVFVKEHNHPDANTRRNVRDLFVRVWRQMISVKQEYHPAMDMIRRSCKKERCHEYLWPLIEAKYAELTPDMYDSAMTVARDLIKQNGQSYKAVVGKKRTLVCAQVDDCEKASCPICTDALVTDKHIVLVCGHSICDTCFHKL